VSHDRCSDGLTRRFSQPTLEDRGVRPSIGRDPMDHQLVIEGDDIGSADPRNGRDDADAMEPAEERDLATMRGPTTCRELRHEGCLTPEVAAEPGLALGQERHGVALAIPPAGTSGDRHDDASLGMEHDPESASSRRMAERERDRAAGKVGDGRRL
jgi:hypothetical protein